MMDAPDLRNPRMVAGAQKRWASERKKGVLYAIRGVAYGARYRPISEAIALERLEKVIECWLKKEPWGTLEALLENPRKPFTEAELLGTAMVLYIAENDERFEPVDKSRMVWRLLGA